MKKYEKPIAEVLMFRLEDVRMVPRFSKGEGDDYAMTIGEGDQE